MMMKTIYIIESNNIDLNLIVANPQQIAKL